MNQIICLIFLFAFWINLQGQSEKVVIRIFANGIISLPDIDETSPSFTADGQTMVFARTTGWEKKIPFIATKQKNEWQVERLNFTDTLYNLAITPNGERIIFKKYELLDGQEVSRTYMVNKQHNKWSTPIEVSTLFNINAGYFCPVEDGTLYFFARSPKTGVYFSEPNSNTIYSVPQWLSDKVSPTATDSFDILMHPEENQLLITRYYVNQPTAKHGIYWFTKTLAGWQLQKRLSLSYGWGSSVLNNKDFVFVKDGNLQSVSLKKLGITW